MGRRALRKIDPTLDLSRHFRAFAQLPQPWDAAAIFGREAPLVVEVGSGKGLFMRSAAAAEPAMDFLGLEIVEKYAKFSAAGLLKRNLTNAVMVAGDAQRIFNELFPNDSLEAVHVYFPDPWWKKRHRKRRVMNEGFLKNVERTLKPGRLLHFWTDVEEYFTATLELIATSTTLLGPLEVPEKSPEHDLDYRTHFERRMRRHDEAVYRSEFKKRES
ncbi:MAG: tRNA (guanosine(46)-N7)-methyltransferase TrmB [Pirellulales bacterium]|nr:tRNA (guanosine(46)-N7)-methyltransferase TrmB [Pirellulales bacterium]